jgi:hypothetical protein
MAKEDWLVDEQARKTSVHLSPLIGADQLRPQLSELPSLVLHHCQHSVHSARAYQRIAHVIVLLSKQKGPLQLYPTLARPWLEATRHPSRAARNAQPLYETYTALIHRPEKR